MLKEPDVVRSTRAISRSNSAETSSMTMVTPAMPLPSPPTTIPCADVLTHGSGAASFLERLRPYADRGEPPPSEWRAYDLRHPETSVVSRVVARRMTRLVVATALAAASGAK